MIRPHRLGDTSTFLGQTCALCKQAFEVGDQIVVCPEDGSRHHTHCWEANNNHCTAYGCKGQGEVGVAAPVLVRPTPRRAPAPPTIIEQPPDDAPAQPRSTPRPRATRPPAAPPPRIPPPPAARPIPNAPGSKVRTLPSGSFGCVRGCLLFLLFAAIVLVALACAGAWWLSDNYMLAPDFRPLYELAVKLDTGLHI